MCQQDKIAALESVNEALKDSRAMLQQIVADLANDSARQQQAIEDKDEQIKLLMGFLWRAA
jgi:cell division protein FtsB